MAEAARSLLGADLVSTLDGHRRVGRIVEVEAYAGPEDAASHARAGLTPRNAPMFGPPGHAYVYLVFGMHDCLNVVAEPSGAAAAVLIRAVEPLEGIDAMRAARVARRPGAERRIAGLPAAQLAAGPALVTIALGISRAHSGADLCDPVASLHLERGGVSPIGRIVAGPRVGVEYAAEPWRSLPWRFAIADHPSVSRPAPRGAPTA